MGRARGTHPGKPSNSYHGRGYIQLSHDYNYKAASQELGHGDLFYDKPDIVKDSLNYAADVSIWFWNTRVRTCPNFSLRDFGATTRAINSIECDGRTNTPEKRYQIYLVVARELGISNVAG